MSTDFKLFQDIEFPIKNVHLDLDLDDIFFLKCTQKRVIEVNSEINDTSAQLLARAIIQINQEDKGIPVEERKPIRVILSSYGGEVDSGFKMIDAMLNSKTPVWTINIGQQYSMAAIVGLAGEKRYASKNALFLLHDGTVTVYDSGSKVHDYIEFDMALQKRMKDFVTSRTKISAKTYEKKGRDEWYFFADEAKKIGVIDGIIGEDIDLEDII